jgi:hypothetical protein
MDTATTSDALGQAGPVVVAPLLGSGVSVWLLLLGLLALLASSVLSRIARLGSRFAMGGGYRLTRWAVVLRTLAWALLFFCALGWIAAHTAPVVGLVLIAGLLGLLTVTGAVRDVAGTLFAQVRLRLGEGDRVRIGDAQGEIRRMHWDHLSLRALDGQSVLVPGRALLTEVIRVQPLREAILLERTVRATLSADGMARLLDAVAVCPYRVADTPMSVVPLGDGVCVSLYVWSQEAGSAAERQLRQTIGALASAPAKPAGR